MENNIWKNYDFTIDNIQILIDEVMDDVIKQFEQKCDTKFLLCQKEFSYFDNGKCYSLKIIVPILGNYGKKIFTIYHEKNSDFYKIRNEINNEEILSKSKTKSDLYSLIKNVTSNEKVVYALKSLYNMANDSYDSLRK